MCKALGVDRASVRHRSVRPDGAGLRAAMRVVAGERRRFGYRRIHIMLGRQGIVMNQKKLRRLYREEKLQARRRGAVSERSARGVRFWRIAILETSIPDRPLSIPLSSLARRQRPDRFSEIGEPT